MTQRGHRQPDDRREKQHRHAPCPPAIAAARMHRVEEMPDRHPHQEHQRGNDPVILRGKGQRIVIAQHQEDHRQGKVIVMGRAQLGDTPILCLRHAPGLEIGHHDALIGHDDKKHVRRHDRGGERPQMQHHRTPGEDLRIAPAHRDQQREQHQHQQRRPPRQPGFAQPVIDHPAKAQRGGGNRDPLPNAQPAFRRDQVDLGPRPVDHHQQCRPRQPGRITLPFEPGQMLGHPRRRHEVFADMVKPATMHLPFLALRALGQVIRLPQPQIERDEIE